MLTSNSPKCVSSAAVSININSNNNKSNSSINNNNSSSSSFFAPNKDNADLDYFENPSDIFKSIEEGEIDLALDLLKGDNGVEAKKWVLRMGGDGSITWRRLPIHEACIRDPSPELIDALISAYPLGVKEVDTCHRLPLHHACVHGASEAVILRLLKADPESIEAKDKWNKTPLSIAEVSANQNKTRIYTMLLKGKEYYYKKAVEDVWVVTLKEEKKKFDAKVKNMEVKSRLQIAAIDQSVREVRSKYQAEINGLTERVRTLTSDQDIAEKRILCYADEIEDFRTKLKTCENEKIQQKKQFDDDNLFVDSFKDLMAKQKTMYEGAIKQCKDELADDRSINTLLVDSMTKEIKSLTEKKTSFELENDDLRDATRKYEETKDLLASIVEHLGMLHSNQDGILEAIATQERELIGMESVVR